METSNEPIPPSAPTEQKTEQKSDRQNVTDPNTPHLPILKNTEEEIRKQYAVSKKDRKKAEEDRKLLANRLRLLKMEEEKALKKIEMTRKKAKEVALIKLRNAEEQKKKEEAKKRKEEQQKQLKEAYKGMKEKMKEGLKLTKEQLLNQKKAKVGYIKSEKQELKQQAFYKQNLIEDEVKSRKDIIRSQEMKIHQSKYRHVVFLLSL